MKFDEINIGDQAEITHTITAKDVEKFVELTGDDNRLHIDSEYAQTTSLKKPVVHGMLGASFISTIIGTKLPGDGALWFSQSLDFLAPIRVGEKIRVTAEVVKKYQRDKIIQLKTDIYDNNKQLVTAGVAKVKVIETEKKPKEDIPIAGKKVALVLGATGGIGSAVCDMLAQDGFDLGAHYHSNEKAAHDICANLNSKNCRAIAFAADITDADQVREMVDFYLRKFGTITTVVNCTTPAIYNTRFADLEWKDIEHYFNTIIKGTYNIFKAVVPHMEPLKYGKIISFTTQAIETPNAEWSHYITAKSALNGFLKCMALELAPKGIRVNMISPGMTDTDLISDIPEKVRLLTVSKTPLRRLAKPVDIASAVSFLASEKSDFMAGETLRVNGGQLMI